MTGTDEAIDRKNTCSVRQLRNHWKRPPGPLGYYWFLTFEESPELRSLVKNCQDSIDFPFYDPTPPDSLHLTIDRIAPADDISAEQLESIESSAMRACRAVSPFELGIDRLSGVPSAVALDVSPAHAVHKLRETLRVATLSACPELRPEPPKPHPPHISIAYANSDGVPALGALQAVEKANETIQRIDVEVTEALLVFLRRRQRSYSWQVVSRISLASGEVDSR